MRLRLGPHQREHGIAFGLVLQLHPLLRFKMVPKPSEVAFDRSGSDVESIRLVGQAQRSEIALETPTVVQHRGVDRPTRCARHVVGTHAVQESLRIGAFDANLAEGRLIEQRSVVVSLCDFTSDLIEPRRLAERQRRIAVAAEVKWPLPPVHLTELRFRILPPCAER